MKKGLERAREQALAMVNGPERAKAQAVAVGKKPESTRAQAGAVKNEPQMARAQAAAVKNEPQMVRAQAAAVKNEPQMARAQAAAGKNKPQMARAQAAAMKNGPERARAQAAAMKNGPDRARAQAAAMKNGPDRARAQAAAMKNGPDGARAQAAAMKNGPEGMRGRGVAMKKGHGAAAQQVSKHSSHATNTHRKNRRKKRIILSIIVIVSCIMFAGSGVLIAIGYLNPGPIGLGILGAGAVLYFVTAISLACCCICTDKKYPGRYSQSIIDRIRRRTRDPANSLINPPGRGRPQVQPPKPAAGHRGQARPNQPKDHQAQIPTPNFPRAVDQTIIAVPTNVSDGISPTAPSLETQQTDINTQIPQTSDVTITLPDDPPVDVRIVSRPKKEQRPQEKTPADAVSEGNNIPECGDPSIDVRIVSTPKREQDQEQKSSVSDDFVNMTIAVPPVDTKIPVNAKEGHGLQEKTDTSCFAPETSTISSPYPNDNLIIIPQGTKNQHQEVKTATHPNSEDISTGSASGPLIDVRIVSNKPMAERQQKNTLDPNYLENTVSAKVPGELATLLSQEPQFDVGFVSHHKQNQHCKETASTAPSHGEFTVPGATSATNVLVPSHHIKEKQEKRNPPMAWPKDVLATDVLDSVISVKPIPHHRKSENPQQKSTADSSSDDPTSAPAAGPPVSDRALTHPWQDQNHQAKIPAVPRRLEQHQKSPKPRARQTQPSSREETSSHAKE